MPQFDSLSFLSQIFWSFGTFGFLYVSVLRVIIPCAAVVLKARSKFVRFEPSLLTEHNEDVIFKGVASINAEPLVVRSVKLGHSRMDQLSGFGISKLHDNALYSLVSFRLFTIVSLRSMQSSKSAGLMLWLSTSSGAWPRG